MGVEPGAATRRGTTIGIDIGGTFTDIVVVRDDGRMYKAKVSSSFRDTVNGIIAGVRDLLADSGIAPGTVTSIVHGTTVATNAILEHKGAITGLVTTAGFRDVLEIGRLRRPSLYDIFWDKPPPLARRARRLEVKERVASDGAVLVPLDPDEVRTRVTQLRAAGATSIAVSLLNSYANAVHEQAIASLIRREHPDVHLSVSTEILPEIREYERTSTTVVNAYIGPVVDRYLAMLEAELRQIGLECPLYLMQSNGGMIDAATARTFPVYIVESGPAAGVLATSYLASQTGLRNLIAFDMGGTTAKASMVENARVTVSAEYEVGAGLNSGRRLMKGAGYPIRIPSVDVAEVGAGGGSIAWIDPGGALQVGPHSAGAEPGPACYGTGGTEPTVTDANVVLGYMNPERLAGGRIRIDRELSWRAIKDRIADPLGMDVLECAYGIHAIANANMIRAVRSVSTERGRDPRAYDLVCFGGAGAIHAAGMAALLGIPRVVVPVSPGLFSAIGLHFADSTRDFVQTYLRRLESLAPSDIRAQFAAQDGACRAFLDARDFARQNREIRFSADLRYLGQAHELTIPIAAETLAGEDLVPRLAEDFAREHERVYGHRGEARLVEVVNLRSRAVGLSAKIPYRDLWASLDATEGHDGSRDSREAYFGPEKGRVSCTVLRNRRSLLERTLDGPLIVEEFDTTIVVPPGDTASLDAFGNVVIGRG